MRTWFEVETALRARPRWRRIGREWHGPCPVQGIGKNACWFAEGSRSPVRGGCRKCGGRLAGAAFREHLEAIVGGLGAASAAGGQAPPARISAPTRPDPLPGRVWLASVALAPTSPGSRYLCSRGVIDASGRVPPSVRWLPLGAAVSVRCAPRLPAACAGALVYRFAAPGEPDTWAVQFEPVDEAGRRLPCLVRGVPIKRPSVSGSSFALGRRVFSADGGADGRGCWLVEGPLDALAVVQLARCAALALDGAAVLGVPGAELARVPACEPGPVTVALDGDHSGAAAAVRLLTTLRRLGREARIRSAPDGMDWTDVLAEIKAERGAIRDECG